ncbi:MAG: family 43 glycosylhydrolase [Actinomycetota bacterium]|nr:family 43 glycosylhydrolase [Actinomycetota bacterium]
MRTRDGKLDPYKRPRIGSFTCRFLNLKPGGSIICEGKGRRGAFFPFGFNPLFTWGETADPGMLAVGGGYVVASTSRSDEDGAMPIRFSSDRVSWAPTGRIFRPSGIPEWVDRPRKFAFWAPQLYYLPSIQRFVAYYSAIQASTGKRCIGRATSSELDNFAEDPVGPLLCSSNEAGGVAPAVFPSVPYGLIDPALFSDPRDGQLYLLYKREKPENQMLQVPTQIAITSIGADGRSGIGRPYVILTTSQPWESASKGVGWSSVESPTMVYKDGAYYLFYSGNGFKTDKYAVGVARSSSPVGSPPGWTFEKYAGNPILSGDSDPAFCGVGHQDVTYTDRDGWLIFYHAYTNTDTANGKPKNCKGGRYLMMDRLRWDQPGGWPRVHDGTPDG